MSQDPSQTFIIVRRIAMRVVETTPWSIAPQEAMIVVAKFLIAMTDVGITIDGPGMATFGNIDKAELARLYRRLLAQVACGAGNAPTAGQA
jgi:hypothetical protein